MKTMNISYPAKISKTSTFLVTTALLFGVLGQPNSVSADIPASLQSSYQWNQSFDEEFNANAVDTGKWINQAVYWDGSNLQGTDTYCPSPYGPTAYYYQSETQDGNNLHLQSLYAPGTDPGYYYEYARYGFAGVTALNYTSNWMTPWRYSNGQPLQAYGYFECRMKASVTQGVDTAFWMFSPTANQEIDVAEFAGAPSFSLWDIPSNSNKYGGHGSFDQGYIINGGRATLINSQDFTTDYHTYGVDWEPDHIAFYLDGNQTYYDTYNVPTGPMYMIVSQQMQDDGYRTDGKPAGNWFGSASNGQYPCTTLVDYVRAYQRGAATGFSGDRKIVARNNGNCLDCYGSADGAGVQLWPYWGGDVNSNQKWLVQDAGGGYYKIISKNTGKCLEVYGPNNGTNIASWPYWGGNANSNQQWAITPTDSGYYKITEKNNGKSLDAYGGNGANVAVWDYWGGDSNSCQQWAIQVAN